MYPLVVAKILKDITMRANDEYFLRFLEGHDKRFSVPIYQRNYDWKREHCEALFYDIFKILQHQKDYFIGSIVILYENQREYLIVDGQQRITTISLLMLAMCNLMEKLDYGRYRVLIEQIKENYLVDKYAEENKRVRLKPVHKDNDAFLRLFSGNPTEYIPDSSITINYNFLWSLLWKEHKKGMQFDDFYSAMKKLRIVQIELNVGIDDPQAIFESLNSTGQQLDEADLVRNFILMQQRPEIQKKFFEEYWQKIEENTHRTVSDFLRFWLIYKTRNIPSKGMVYKTFKDYVLKEFNREDFEDLLLELRIFSEYYNAIIDCNYRDEDIDETLKRINSLKMTVSYPFIFELFDCCSQGIISSYELGQMLKIIETYVVRRFVCGLPSNALNAVFSTLRTDIRRHEAWQNNYFEVFKWVLLANGRFSSNRFPADIEFSQKLVEKDIYGNRVYCSYILAQLENYDNAEKVAIDDLSRKTITIEHVMPQTLTREWKEMLGDQALERHQQFVNTLGNLTLTGYNSKYSNSSFDKKKTMEHGFCDSRLKLNKYIAEQSVWNFDKIRDRSIILKNLALHVWPYIETEYEVLNTPDEYVYLSENYDFTGHRPIKIIFMGDEYNVSDWASVLVKVLELLCDIDQNLLISKAFSVSNRYLSVESSNLRRPKQVIENLFVETNISSKDCIKFMQEVLFDYNISEDELGILLAR